MTDTTTPCSHARWTCQDASPDHDAGPEVTVVAASAEDAARKFVESGEWYPGSNGCTVYVAVWPTSSGRHAADQAGKLDVVRCRVTEDGVEITN